MIWREECNHIERELELLVRSFLFFTGGCVKMKDRISAQEFSAIAAKVLEHNADVDSFSVCGSSISVKIVSRLRGENVDAYLDFDDGGKITGRFSYAQTRGESSLPLIIGNTIAECIKKIRAV